jgi:phospholipase C
MTSKNIGDLLNSKGITWGGFTGGFNLLTVNDNGSTAARVKVLVASVMQPKAV